MRSAPRSSASTRSVAYAKDRKTFGKPLATNQAIQFPLVELHTEAEMLRGLVRKTAWQLDREHHMEVSDMVAMCNYRANRLVCDAADRAMQVHGGIGYSRHMPFEHIYRHHRRYRITEGSEEIQMRRVAGTCSASGARRRPRPRRNPGLSAIRYPPYGSSPPRAGERKGPIAQRWEGEVVPEPETMCVLNRRMPTSPSPRYARVPSVSPREDAGGEGL